MKLYNSYKNDLIKKKIDTDITDFYFKKHILKYKNI